MNIEVRYRCTSAPCRKARVNEIAAGWTGAPTTPAPPDVALLEELSSSGCPRCGAKRLEIWHPTKGHVLIDYRAQKSVRKNRRRRRLAALGAGVLGVIFAALGCTPAPGTLGEPSLLDTLKTSRAAPAANWTIDGETTVVSDAMDENHDRIRIYFAGAGAEAGRQIWRVEWTPDSCFSPLAYPMLAHGTPPGLLAVQLTGVAPGDKILFWRSHPWDADLVAELDSTTCLEPVREDG